MKRIAILMSLFMITGLATPSFAATAEIGKAAPGFKLTGADGKEHSLSQYKGKTVVLEWFNNECPYVKKHYDVGNMQKLQTEAAAKGTVWLTINSSAPGKQGHLTTDAAAKLRTERKMANTSLLLDPKGTVGSLYGAKTTPHMYVIDPKGVLAYAGAIDSDSSADPKTIAGANNYVSEALAAVAEGKAVKTTTTKPYGCSVKYE
ncbi:MAG: thioredoxin family protein [Bdellovibrio sp.]|jgi:peroxiredoxin